MKYFILASVFEGLEETAETYGYDYSEALAACGFDQLDPLKPNCKVDFTAYLKLLDTISREVGRPDFGIIIGVSTRKSIFGLVSRAVELAPTLRDLANILETLVSVLTNAMTIKLTASDIGELVVELRLNDANAPGSDVFIDATLAALVKLGIVSHQKYQYPTFVFLERSRPKNILPYQNIFGPDVQFNHGKNAMIFSPEMLRIHRQGADPNTFEWMKEIVEIELREARKDHN